jgi:hypothetical protein
MEFITGKWGHRTLNKGGSMILNFHSAVKSTKNYFFYFILGLLTMVCSSTVNAEGAPPPLEAVMGVENIEGYLHIKPSIKWVLAVNEQEAQKFKYHLSVIKSGKGGTNNTSQKGSIPLKELNKSVVLSSTKINYIPEASYEFNLKIYRNDELIASQSNSL